MAKSTDFPVNVREFGKLLDKFYGHHDYEVFIDFIDYTICCFLMHGDPEKVEFLKRKYGKLYPHFIDMYRCFLETHMRLLGENDFDWYDTLGEVYEAITSRSKSSALGQFFTPKPVCDVMAQILHIDKVADGQPVKGLRVNDCACGSGRTLLAFNKVAPGNLLYGEDLDPVATKMAAINLALHGCKGQVSNMDSLMMDWRWGYEINPFQYTMMGMPHLIPIEKHQSYTVARFEQELKGWADEQPEQPVPKIPEHTGQQLALFSHTNIINMKGSQQFKEVIKKHLEGLAEKDPLFAKTYAKENKNIDDCINYILSEVQRSGINGFADEEIYKMAVHYYDEDDIKPGKPASGRVVVNHHVELTEEEIAQAKEKAMQEAIEKQKKALSKKKPSKPDQQATGVQTSLF